MSSTKDIWGDLALDFAEKRVTRVVPKTSPDGPADVKADKEKQEVRPVVEGQAIKAHSLVTNGAPVSSFTYAGQNEPPGITEISVNRDLAQWMKDFPMIRLFLQAVLSTIHNFPNELVTEVIFPDEICHLLGEDPGRVVYLVRDKMDDTGRDWRERRIKFKSGRINIMI